MAVKAALASTRLPAVTLTTGNLVLANAAFTAILTASQRFPPISRTSTSTYRTQHEAPASTQSFERSRASVEEYERAKRRDMEVARASPPRPSKAGVAFAEQSTKNSSLPWFRAPGKGASSSALTPTKISVLARRR